MSEVKTIEIPLDLGNEIAAYMGQRPYLEVAHIISRLQSAAQLSLDADSNKVIAPAQDGENDHEQ